jgi:hypothetical protein
MAAKGKWAQGIKPRHFNWIIQDQLAMCERPGGYGTSHRRVRRQEEIIWIREQGFAPVMSLIPAPHNLHNYDELGVSWIHRPFRGPEDYYRYLGDVYTEISRLLAGGSKVLVHHEELGDRLVGFMAGYLVWADLVEETPRAVFLMEHISNRQIEPPGREIVAVADRIRGERNS